MLKVLLASALCVLMLACVNASDFVEIEIIGQPSSQSIELDSKNSTSRSKRGLYWPYSYGYYGYDYYNWYSVYNSYFVGGTCGIYSCPNQCPGTCGTWSGLHACRCNTVCPLVGDVCNYANIGRGLYLHSYPYDHGRYVQCDSTPGVYYIRNCPYGLVFDARFGVCNYAYATYWGK